MKSNLRAGDHLIVHSIDKFGRNYTQICKEWESFIDKGVDIQVLDMPILNTRDNQTGLTGRLISDIILKLLGYVAEKKNQYQNQTKRGYRLRTCQRCEVWKTYNRNTF